MFVGSMQASVIARLYQHEPPLVRQVMSFSDRRQFLARQLPAFNDQSAVKKAVRSNRRSLAASRQAYQVFGRRGGQSVPGLQPRRDRQGNLCTAPEPDVTLGRGMNYDATVRVRVMPDSIHPSLNGLVDAFAMSPKRLESRCGQQFERNSRSLDHYADTTELPPDIAERKQAEMQPSW
jgi:hypothetical protein